MLYQARARCLLYLIICHLECPNPVRTRAECGSSSGERTEKGRHTAMKRRFPSTNQYTAVPFRSVRSNSSSRSGSLQSQHRICVSDPPVSSTCQAKQDSHAGRKHAGYGWVAKTRAHHSRPHRHDSGKCFGCRFVRFGFSACDFVGTFTL